MNTSLRKVNKEKKYTMAQLQTWKKFEGKYLNVYPYHYDYWVDGKGWETVYHVRGVSNEIRENYNLAEEIPV